MESLWPEEISKLEAIKSPVSILKEQASSLGKMTKNILVGEIVPVEVSQPNSAYRFNILAPLLRNYRYTLFIVNYNILNMYPIYINLDEEIYKEVYYSSEKEPLKIDNESELISNLTRIFRSNKVKQILKSLMAESGAMNSGGTR